MGLKLLYSKTPSQTYMIIDMRYLIATILAVFLICGMVLFAQPKAPETLVFETKMGKVTYNHAEHVKRAKNDCATCHPKLFQQDAKAPLNYKAGMHKTAETNKTSCASCHVAGGSAFESKANCKKCHVK